MTNLSRRTALMGLSAIVATPTLANHPGEDLDARMMEKEKFFQIIDEPQAPPFHLQDAGGKIVRLSDFEDKITVMHFVYANCPDICPLHAEKMAAIQSSINSTPMKDMVQFISITTDPKNDIPDVLRDYAEWHGLDPINWMFLTKRTEQDEDATRKLAKDYGLEFTMTKDSGTMVHGAVIHVIDRGGRFAGKFHGMRFQNVNLVLYINGLLNNAQHRRADVNWWDKVKGVFN